MKTKIRTQREENGLTQADVARQSNITERNYQRIEQEEQEPGVRTAIRIAKALNSTVEDLFWAATPDNTKQPGGNPAKHTANSE